MFVETGLIQAPDLPEISIVPSWGALFEEDHKDGPSVNGEVDKQGRHYTHSFAMIHFLLGVKKAGMELY